MVAHDRWLLSQVGAEAWELNEKGLTVFPDFAAYDSNRRARLSGADEAMSAIAQGGDSHSGGRGGLAAALAAQPLSRDEQKRLKREQADRRNALHKELKPMLGRYEALEAELAEVLDQQGTVEGQLADPDVYADHARSGELLKNFESCKQRSEAILEEMTGLEENMAAARAKWNVEQD